MTFHLDIMRFLLVITAAFTLSGCPELLAWLEEQQNDGSKAEADAGTGADAAEIVLSPRCPREGWTRSPISKDGPDVGTSVPTRTLICFDRGPSNTDGRTNTTCEEAGGTSPSSWILAAHPDAPPSCLHVEQLADPVCCYGVGVGEEGGPVSCAVWPAPEGEFFSTNFFVPEEYGGVFE